MKKPILCFLAFVLFVLSTSTSFAQVRYQLYVSDVKTQEPQYQVGDMVQGEFTLFNVASQGQSDIYYTISSGMYDPEALAVLSVQGASEKQGPIYMKEKAKQTIPFSYTLPQSLSGDVAIQITATLQDGTLVAQGYVPLIVAGNTNQEIITPFNDGVLVSTLETNVPSAIGVTIYEEETVQLLYSINPTEKAYTLIPTLKLYDRTDNESALITTKTYDPITTSTGDDLAKYTLDLPTDLEPLVYYGVISFDGQGVDVTSIDVRYIISGPIATVRNITTETLQVKKGESFDIMFSYGGQPLDEVRPEMQTETGEVTATIIATNESGEEVARTTNSLDMTGESREITITLDATANAKSLSFSATLTNPDGTVLDEYQTELPTQDSLDNQESLTLKKQLSPIAITFIALLGVLLIAILIVFKKKMHDAKIPIVILLGGVVIAGSLMFTRGVSAWEIFHSNGGATSIFTLNTVISPLPAEVKLYEPGERFNFTYQASFGDCNNESMNFYAYGSNRNNDWWNQTPPGAGQNWNQKKTYWQQNGTTFLDGKGDWKKLVLTLDLITQIGVDEDLQSDLRELLEYYDIKYRTTSGHWATNPIKHDLKIRGVYGLFLNTYVIDYFDSPGRIFTNLSTMNFDVRYSPNLSYVINSLQTYEGSELNRVKALLARNNVTNPLYSNIDFSQTSELQYIQRDVSLGGRGGTRREQIPGNEYTMQYLKGYFALHADVSNFADPYYQQLLLTIPTRDLYDKAFPKYNYAFSQTYTAPTTPGFHKIYGHIAQNSNGGVSDITFFQEICVIGNGECPNEVVEQPPICPFLTGNFTKDANGIIYRDGQATDYVQNEAGQCSSPVCEGPNCPCLDGNCPDMCPDGSPLPANGICSTQCDSTNTQIQSYCQANIVYNRTCSQNGTWTITPTQNSCTLCNSTYNAGDTYCQANIQYSRYCSLNGTWAVTPTGNTCTNPQCPDGSPVPTNGICPAATTCPNGSPVPTNGICPAATTCPNGSPVPTNGICPAATICPNGSPMPASGICPVATTCPNGSPMPANGICPAATTCPNGSPMPANGICPLDPFTATCTAPRIAIVGAEVTYTATPSNATNYSWYQGATGNLLSRGTTNQYKTRYSTVGTKRVTVDVTKDSQTKNAQCSATYVDCNGSHDEGDVEVSCNDQGREQYWTCTEGSTGWRTVWKDCGGNGGDDGDSSDPIVTTFEFDPGIINPNANPPNNMCGITLNASNVTSCTLTRTTGNAPQIQIPLTSAGTISVQRDRRVPTGRYELTCSSATVLNKSFGVKTCLANANVRED